MSVVAALVPQVPCWKYSVRCMLLLLVVSSVAQELAGRHMGQKRLSGMGLSYVALSVMVA